MTTTIALAIGLIIGIALLVLNVREILYLFDKQQQAKAHGQTSWLISTLLHSTATTTAVAVIFLVLFFVRIVWGVQPWSPWVSILAILGLLLIPVLRGIEIRRHDV